MEENNFDNETSVEHSVAPEAPIEAPVVEEAVVEAPMPETKVEEVAVENNINASVTEAEESTDAITTSNFGRSNSDTVQGIGSVANGVIGVAETPRLAKAPAPVPSKKKALKTVAIYSSRNVSWSGVGKVNRGYNIVTQEEADKWVTRDHIRLATPEEVAKEFGR